MPSLAFADPTAGTSPLPPRTQLGQAPTGGPAAPQVPGKGALGSRRGQLRGHSPPRCQLRRGQAREGRGRGRFTRPPQDCPGRPACPRSARAFPSCSICGRLTPSGASAPPGASVLWGGSVWPSLSAMPLSGGPLPTLHPVLVLSVAPPLRRSSQPGEGPVLRSHEGGNPPFAVPPPEPAPLAGIRSKKWTGAPGPGVHSPPPARPCPRLGRCA